MPKSRTHKLLSLEEKALWKRYVSSEARLPSILLNEQTRSHVQGQLLLPGVLSERSIYLNLHSFPLRDACQHTIGMISVLHEITPGKVSGALSILCEGSSLD